MSSESDHDRFHRMLAALRDASGFISASADRGVDIRQTHMSVVFLLDDVVYKIKKPVNFGFVDYTTIERRKAMCENELRLNRRLAPSVYLDVVAICYDNGAFIVDPPKISAQLQIVDYAVKMVRLADDHSLLDAVRNNAVREEHLLPIVNLIATFHNKTATRSPSISKFGSYDVISYNMIENFTQTTNHVEAGRSLNLHHKITLFKLDLVKRSIYEEVKTQQLQCLDDLRPLIDDRAAHDCPCDSHGDLRLEHIYRNGEETLIIDCIEFNDRFRYEDPLCDIAFLYMDLLYETCSFRLPNALLDSYLSASDITPSADIKALTLLYASYRSVVRTKVVGITAIDPDTPQTARDAARRRSRKHWNIALQLLLPPRLRIGLVLVSGLPGSGKSTVARSLASNIDAVVLRTDTIRKEAATAISYTADSKAQIYSIVFDRARQALDDRRLVIVDATFNLEGEISRFQHLARDQGFLFAIFLCQCKDETEIRRRLSSRTGDASDADWRVYEEMVRTWAGPNDRTEAVELVDTTGSLDATKTNAMNALRRIGLS